MNLNPDLTYAFAAEITKVEPDGDDLIVYGKATGPDLDLDGDRCDPAWLKKAMPDWFEWGNIREMHQPVLAGIGLELTEDGDDWYIKSKCIDPTVQKKIKAGGYKGYSIGIKNGERHNGIIDAGIICEVSYVDRPCNPTAKLALAKSAGGPDAPWEAAETPTRTPKTVEIQPGEDIKKALERSPEPVLADEWKGGFTKAIDQHKLDNDDVKGAFKAIARISDLIISEAKGLGQGDLHEIYDIQRLMDAACALQCFIGAEQGETDKRSQDDALPEYATYAATPDDDDALKKYVSAAARRSAAKAGNALPDGSYPIRNTKELHAAIVLAQSGHGNVAAAKKLIKRRARELGAQSMLPASWGGGKSKMKSKKNKANAPATTKALSTESGTVVPSNLTEIVKTAVAEAAKADKKRIKALEADLAKVLATPIPGGPQIVAPAQQRTADDETADKIKSLRAQAAASPRAIAKDINAYADKLEAAARSSRAS